MDTLKITILNDNRPGRKLLSEHGLSFYVEFKKHKVLLDAGSSDVFLKNAKALQIDLHKVDAVVLSHGHWDHGDGLTHINGQKLITHPGSFIKRYHTLRDKSYVGLALSLSEMYDKFDVQLSKDPVYISDEIIYLGEIPRLNNFEALSTAFVDGDGKDDFIMDDSAIVIKHAKGLVVISGCAHAGICNTVDYAIQITGEERVYAVMGGFHLKKANNVTEQTIAFMNSKKVKYVIPSHCTDLPALSLFHNAFGFQQICTGDVIKFE